MILLMPLMLLMVVVVLGQRTLNRLMMLLMAWVLSMIIVLRSWRTGNRSLLLLMVLRLVEVVSRSEVNVLLMILMVLMVLVVRAQGIGNRYGCKSTGGYWGMGIDGIGR